MHGLVSVNEAAATLGISPWTVRRWVRERRLPVTRLGRALRFAPEALQRHVVANTVEAREPLRPVMPALPAGKTTPRAQPTRARRAVR